MYAYLCAMVRDMARETEFNIGELPPFLWFLSHQLGQVTSINT